MPPAWETVIARDEETLRIVIGLMQQALRLLDNVALEGMAAPRLQHAIDALHQECPALRDAAIDPNLACLVAAIPLPRMAV